MASAISIAAKGEIASSQPNRLTEPRFLRATISVANANSKASNCNNITGIARLIPRVKLLPVGSIRLKTKNEAAKMINQRVEKRGICFGIFNKKANATASAFSVPGNGLEPSPLAGHGPQPCASTNSATRAGVILNEAT